MAIGPTVFVDTNILLYSEDLADPVKHQAARAWLRELWLRRCGRISSPVLDEFYTRHGGQTHCPPGRSRRGAPLSRWQPWRTDQATVENTWAIESRYQLGFGDALIVAAAQQQGCACLLSEDLSHDRQIDGVRIISPFLVGPDLLDASTA
jgi:predicted nucleic acid-binding protein